MSYLVVVLALDLTMKCFLTSLRVIREISLVRRCARNTAVDWETRALRGRYIYSTTICTSFDARCEYVFTARSLVGGRKILTVDWAVLCDLEAKALESPVCAKRIVQFYVIDEVFLLEGWCEPDPPLVWEGYKVKREGLSCSARLYTPGQCFGLGPEVVASQGNNHRLSVKECEAKCCADKDCNMWQAHHLRGCFMSAGDFWCDPTQKAYTGGRKCAKGY